MFAPPLEEFDVVTDAALADRLVTEWRERVGNVDFELLIGAFAKLRS